MIDLSFNPYSVIDTETKLCDFCIKTFKKDLAMLQSTLNSTELFYGSPDTTEMEQKNSGSKLTTGESNGFISKRQQFNSRHRRIQGTFGQSEHNGFGDEQHRFIKKEDSRKLSSDVGKQTEAKKIYKRPSNAPTPFMFNDLDSYFNARCRNSLPTFGPSIGRDQVRTLDQKAIKNYTTDPKNISENMQYFLLGSTLDAFRVLGLRPEFSTGIKRFQPLAIRESVEILAKNTNAGAPTFKKKSNKEVQKSTIHWLTQFLRKPTFYKLRNRFLARAEDFVSSSFNELMMNPIHIMYRFQIRPENDLGKVFNQKLRQVWCVPYSVVALEAMFFSPIIQEIKNLALSSQSPVFPMGLNNRQLSERVILPLHRSKRRMISNKIKSFDFSKFDQHIEPMFTSFFFTLLGKEINFTPRRYKAYNCLRFYTTFSPFIYDGNVYLTRKGICSGSFTTNFRGTVVNLSLVICALRIRYTNDYVRERVLSGFFKSLDEIPFKYRYGIRKGEHYVNVRNCYIYGDDGIVLEDEEFFKIHKFICDSFHQNVGYKECDNLPDNSFYFLGRFWNNTGRPWQTVEYIIAHIQYRTKFYKKEEVDFDISESLDLFRVLSITLPLENGKLFLDTVLYDWEPYRKFIEGNKGFYLLKEWPNDNYSYFERSEAFDIWNY